VREHAQGEGYDIAELGPAEAAQARPVPGFAAIAPIVAVVALNYLFSAQILPRLDTSYLASAAYGAARLDTVRGVWRSSARSRCRSCS
jgi:hypothetical protein